MKLLAIESSSRRLSLAAFEGGQLKLELDEHALMRQNESLAPLAARLLEAIKWKAAELQAVAVSLGPGSFTGLRTGLAFAKGLCFATGARLIGVPTLLAWAEGRPQAQVWLDARRGMVYRHAPGQQPMMLPISQAKAGLAEGVELLGDTQDPEACVSAAAVGRLALLRLQKGEADDASLLEPIYLRRAEAVILWALRQARGA
jgi:tRNA threonylcarbamoyladenosine biosynthesis protein TsaB